MNEICVCFLSLYKMSLVMLLSFYEPVLLCLYNLWQWSKGL